MAFDAGHVLAGPVVGQLDRVLLRRAGLETLDVSRRVAELEGDLGTPLFARGRHNANPTAEAESLAASIRVAFGELAATVETIRRPSLDNNVLTILSDVSLTTTLIAPVIGELQRHHPKVEIRVVSSWDPIEASSEQFNIGLQYRRDVPTSLVVEPIANDQVFPVCTPDLAAELPNPIPPGELADLPLLHVDYDEPAWADWSRFLANLGVEAMDPPEGLVFASYQRLSRCGRAGRRFRPRLGPHGVTSA